MRKLIGLIGALCILLAGCNSTTANKYIDEGRQAIESMQYDAAVQSFELALDNKKDHPEATVLLEQTKQIIDAQHAIAASSFDEAILINKKLLQMDGGSDLLKERAKDAISLAEVKIEEKRKAEAQRIEAEKKAKEKEERLMQLGKAYKPIMMNLVKKYGIWNGASLNESRFLHGVIYADLIDFDNDGSLELYIIYGHKNKTKSNDEYLYDEEIWGLRNGKVAKIAAFEYIDGKKYSGDDRSLVNIGSKTYLISSGSYHYGGDDKRFKNVAAQVDSSRIVYELKDNQFVEISKVLELDVYFLDDSNKKFYYKIDKNKEISITKDEYDRIITKYSSAQTKRIISDGVGTKTVEADMTQNKDNVVLMMHQLQAYANRRTTSNSNELQVKLTDADRSKGNEFFGNFTELKQFDIASYTNLQMMDFIMRSIHAGQISHKLLTPNFNESSSMIINNDWYYFPYSSKVIHTLTNTLFGTTLKETNYKNKDSDIYTAYFKDNKFYILSPNYGSGIESYSTQIDSMYNLGESLYDVEFTLYTFELNEEDTSFLQKPYNSWSNKQKEYIVDEVIGHAVIKKVNNSWQLVSYYRDSNY